MAKIKVTKSSSVKSIKYQFNQDTGATLRIYNGIRFADDSMKIMDLSKVDDPRGELEIRGHTKVGNVEKFFSETFGIKVQIANSDNTKLASNDMTLSKAKNA